MSAEVTVAATAAGVTSALVDAWDAIRARHTDVPEAVIGMATGGRAGSVELVYFVPRRWKLREGDDVQHEVFVTAESLGDGAAKVFGYLLHEATHAANEARGVDDCSASQYHNKEFRKMAEAMRLVQRSNVSDIWVTRRRPCPPSFVSQPDASQTLSCARWRAAVSRLSSVNASAHDASLG